MHSSQSDVDDWQSTKSTLLEKNRHMFNNHVMSDISFTCEGSDKTFYAHKYVLGTKSTKFQAMFYGALPEKRSIVPLPDTNEESLEQFLRFLYTEECTLTGENVVAIMYLADKYLILSLVKKCVNFMLENLNPENVLVALEEAIRFKQEESEERCWEFIECATGEVVASDTFNNMNQTTLAKLLKRNNLKIPEVKLFQAVLRWIDLKLSPNNLEPSTQDRRSIIGEAIYDFRFIGMSHAEFYEHVSRSGLLTKDEMNPIFQKFDGIDSPALKWKLPKRKQSNIVKVSRYPNPKTVDVWGYRGKPDRLCFSVNKAVCLLGVRLFGDEGGSEYQVTFEVKEARVTGNYTSQSNQDDIPGFEVMLDKPIILKRNEVVTLSATITGPNSCYCNAGLPSPSLEGVTVTFSNSPTPNNATCVKHGQFHKIILDI